MAARKRAAGLVKPSKGGRITIPIEYRERLGIGEDTLFQLSVDGDELRVRPVRERASGPGSPWLKELYDLFAPVRDEAKAYSEEEINAVIDEAVKAARTAREGRKGSPWLRELYDELAPIRDGMRGLSEDDVNALVDEAVAEVRGNTDRR